MNEDVFVIPNLHMGGKPGFQMLSPDGLALLAAYSEWLVQRQVDPHLPGVHLVLAGDVVDFLAEEPWEAFSNEAVVPLAPICAGGGPTP